ncbi:MAG: PD-(D/E)XK nuclease family transposase [Lachnospiraceae bacterium]|nr:PD-(D/E)XK nuclease family transposase [Lachnospiraceae bacterium]
MNTEEFNLHPEEVKGNLCDFALFLSVMRYKEAYECLLSIILDEPDFTLTEVRVEEVIMNQKGMRAIRLDAWALDSRNRQFNTEMQNDSTQDDERRRARFYQSLMDSPILKSGKQTRYRQLPDTVIVFITEQDIFGYDRAMYTFTERSKEEPDLPLGDGTEKIFLNMSSRNGRPELVSLLQYLKDSRLDNPNITVSDPRLIRLDEIFNEVRQSEEWEECKMTIMEYAKNIGIQQGVEQGISVFIETFQELKKTTEETHAVIMEKFALSREDADTYIEKYWK